MAPCAARTTHRPSLPKTLPGDGMSFPGDLVRYLFAPPSPRGSPARRGDRLLGNNVAVPLATPFPPPSTVHDSCLFYRSFGHLCFPNPSLPSQRPVVDSSSRRDGEKGGRTRRNAVQIAASSPAISKLWWWGKKWRKIASREFLSSIRGEVT